MADAGDSVSIALLNEIANLAKNEATFVLEPGCLRLLMTKRLAGGRAVQACRRFSWPELTEHPDPVELVRVIIAEGRKVAA